MYYLTTLGYGYNKLLCEDVVDWYVSKFLPRHKLFIDVIHRGMKREESYGYCDYACDANPYKPREFEIEVQTHLHKELYIKTLLHELVHLKQWVQGTLKMRAGKLIFRGEKMDQYEYMEQPHEIEAFGSENKLYLDYMFDSTGDWLGDE